MASDKTNVMRVLEQHKIAYTAHEYPHGKDAVDGVTVAQLLGQNVDQVFKTLVARGKSGGYHVFVIPVARELDLKKAFPTVFDESVNGLPSVIVSAGKIGYQIECAPADLIGLVRAKTAPITTD